MPEDRVEDVHCTCGEKLVDAIDPPEVEVGERRFHFRRTTDHLICPACQLSYRVTELGPERDDQLSILPEELEDEPELGRDL